VQPDERVRALLEHGEIELLGVMEGASNYTFAATVTHADLKTLAIWKPAQGEQPLWDFPDETLWRREVAAYELSDALGWDIVPLTISREGPYGIGSLQLFIDHVEGEHYMTLLDGYADAFRLVAAFDILSNNADRKSSHCMLEKLTNKIKVIDHGVCFHVDEKLRTVIWDFAGEELPPDIVRALRALDTSQRFDDLLEPEEITALRARADALLSEGSFPNPPMNRRPYPWPPV
jgi:uncharacterized repeat protein (TIGR03843 family)